MQLGAICGALFLCAIVLGWRAGEAPAPSTAPAAAAEWALPGAKATDPERDMAVLAARRPWGSQSFRDPEEGVAPPPGQWRLAGIVLRGDKRLALILLGSGPTATLEYRAVGDRLPDNSVLVQIDADSATSEGGASGATVRRAYRLFDQRP